MEATCAHLGVSQTLWTDHIHLLPAEGRRSGNIVAGDLSDVSNGHEWDLPVWYGTQDRALVFDSP